LQACPEESRILGHTVSVGKHPRKLEKLASHILQYKVARTALLSRAQDAKRDSPSQDTGSHGSSSHWVVIQRREAQQSQNEHSQKQKNIRKFGQIVNNTFPCMGISTTCKKTREIASTTSKLHASLQSNRRAMPSTAHRPFSVERHVVIEHLRRQRQRGHNYQI